MGNIAIPRPQAPQEPTKDVIIKQYEILIDVYKHWLDLILKYNVAYYAGTGAITSYYLAHKDAPLLRYSLLLPIAIGIGLAIFCFLTAYWIHPIDEQLINIRERLNLITTPDPTFITKMLRGCAVFCGLTAIGLLILFVASFCA